MLILCFHKMPKTLAHQSEMEILGKMFSLLPRHQSREEISYIIRTPPHALLMVGCEMRFYQGAFTLSLYEQFDTIADKVQYKLFHPAEANFWSVFYKRLRY